MEGGSPRFYGFAGGSEFDVFCWIIDDVTDPDAPAYGVYCHRRFDDAFVKMARTFEGFIRLFTNQTEYRKRKHAKVSNPKIADPTDLRLLQEGRRDGGPSTERSDLVAATIHAA